MSWLLPQPYPAGAGLTSGPSSFYQLTRPAQGDNSQGSGTRRRGLQEGEGFFTNCCDLKDCSREGACAAREPPDNMVGRSSSVSVSTLGFQDVLLGWHRGWKVVAKDILSGWKYKKTVVTFTQISTSITKSEPSQLWGSGEQSLQPGKGRPPAIRSCKILGCSTSYDIRYKKKCPTLGHTPLSSSHCEQFLCLI